MGGRFTRRRRAKRADGGITNAPWPSRVCGKKRKKGIKNARALYFILFLSRFPVNITANSTPVTICQKVRGNRRSLRVFFLQFNQFGNIAISNNMGENRCTSLGVQSDNFVCLSPVFQRVFRYICILNTCLQYGFI